MEEEDELSSSLSLLLSLSSEEELEESLLSDDESLEEPSEPLLLSLASLDLSARGGSGGGGQINKQSEFCWCELRLYLLDSQFRTRSPVLILDSFNSYSMTETIFRTIDTRKFQIQMNWLELRLCAIIWIRYGLNALKGQRNCIFH